MNSDLTHEEAIIKEIRELPEAELPRILKFIRFFRTELLSPKKDEERESTGFCGIWEDERSADEIIDDISCHRTGYGNREVEL